MHNEKGWVMPWVLQVLVVLGICHTVRESCVPNWPEGCAKWVELIEYEVQVAAW